MNITENLTPREQIARGRASKMVSWFKYRDLPKELIMGPHMRTDDLRKTVDSLSAVVNAQKPYSKPFISAYNHLLTIKKQLENEQPS